MSETRILLTGCHGLLGQRIIQSISGDVLVFGVDIDSTAYIHGSRFKYAQLDITCRKDVLELCAEFNPDWIINTAAFTNVDRCESMREHCWRVNVEGVEHLAKAAKKNNAKLIHMSTDYIFDNRKEIYTEENRVAPLSYYGKAKHASENAVRIIGSNWVIIRTSTLYDVDTLKGRQNYVTWVIQNLQQGTVIKIVTDQWGNPTFARNLAAGIWRIISLNKSGVFHIAGKEIIDRFSFAVAIAQSFSLDRRLITKTTTQDLRQAAQRPLKIGLDVTKAERELNIHLMDVKQGLAEFKKDYLTVHRNN